MSLQVSDTKLALAERTRSNVSHVALPTVGTTIETFCPVCCIGAKSSKLRQVAGYSIRRQENSGRWSGATSMRVPLTAELSQERSYTPILCRNQRHSAFPYVSFLSNQRSVHQKGGARSTRLSCLIDTGTFARRNPIDQTSAMNSEARLAHPLYSHKSITGAPSAKEPFSEPPAASRRGKLVAPRRKDCF